MIRGSNSVLCSMVVRVLDFGVESLRFDLLLGDGDCTPGQGTLHICILLYTGVKNECPTVVGVVNCDRLASCSGGGRVRTLKFARNLKFATSKTLVNSMKKIMFCLKLGIFQFRKP